MENNKIVKAKKVIFIPLLSNVVVINVLDTKIIEHFKTDPQKLLSYGVTDFYNLIFRISQHIATLNINDKDKEIKNYIDKILNIIVAQIMKASIEFEAGVPFEEIDMPVDFTITKKDEEFLQMLKLNPGSLK
jgi:hypothetical protein